MSAAGSCVTDACKNDVTKSCTPCISAPDGEGGECSGLGGVWALSVIGGETGKKGSGDLAAVDDRVLLLGIKVENWGTFLFWLGFSEIDTEREGGTAFPAVLVLFLFHGSFFCCASI